MALHHRKSAQQMQVRSSSSRYALYPEDPMPRRSSPALRIIKRIVRLFLLLFFVLFSGVCVWGFLTVSDIIRQAPALDAAAVSPVEAATYIYDQDGVRTLKLTMPESNRDLVSIDSVPSDLQYAFVAIEDQRFYTHNGIDPQGILRAFWHGITSGRFDEGASTITQQLLKNSVFTTWTSEVTFSQRLQRKIQEQYLALQLEKLLTKDQILEDYMNTINLGAGCYGVQAAAYCYFGKDVSELTLSECALIAGITQNPTRYNPITHPEENSVRRAAVLQNMLSQHYISQERYDEAMADDVYARIQSNEDTSDSTSSVYTYFEDALIDQVIEDLQTEKGYTYKQALKAVYSGGLHIYSTQDADIQQICDEEFANAANFPEDTSYGIDYALSIEDENGQITNYDSSDLLSWVRANEDTYFNLLCSSDAQAHTYALDFKASVLTDNTTVLGERITVTPQPQASAVIIDQSTGYVRAIVGGRGDKEASLTLNRATYTTRQPGSTFKILAAYAPAINERGKSLATLYENGTYSFADGTVVNNWDGDTDGGMITIREAVTRSVNVAAVECFDEITPQLGYNYLLSFGFTTLVSQLETDSGTVSDINQALVLGGLTYGVTNLQLCAAYACIANAGQYITPKFYTSVTDQNGTVLLDNTAPAQRSVISAAAAYQLTDAMKDVISDPQGTAYGEINLGAMSVCGKTGTTSSYKDIWFAGYTPYYTCCIWGGYDNNLSLPDSGRGHTYDKILWNAIMSRIHESLPERSFTVPVDILNVTICAESALLAGDDCEDTYTEVFSTANIPTLICSGHQAVTILPDTLETDETPEPVVIIDETGGDTAAQENAGAQSSENNDQTYSGGSDDHPEPEGYASSSSNNDGLTDEQIIILDSIPEAH